MDNLFAFLGFCGFVLVVVWMVALLRHISHMRDALELYHGLTGAGPEETEAAVRELEGPDAGNPHEPPENRPY